MEYLTIDEIAKHYWVRRGHATRLAATHDWRHREDADGTVRYDRDDVEATLGPRIGSLLAVR
ncbi:hypothetical protein WEI85_36920 [Actinomycetes bacterium KLBMP 9797]